MTLHIAKRDAAELLGVPESVLNDFLVEDTFNEGNTIGGYLSVSRTKLFGALLICHVNGEDVEPQLVYATPKIKYPFVSKDDGTRVFSWPEDNYGVVFHEKYDGTNILAYSYADASGKRYLTFKTRLTPVLKENRFGDFKSMWQEVLIASEGSDSPISSGDFGLVLSGEYALSFELYGRKNPHLIDYDTDIDARLLFGVRQRDGAVLAPTNTIVSFWSNMAEDISYNVPGDSYTDAYNNAREVMGAALTPLTEGDKNVQFHGSEGQIAYVQMPDGTSLMFKCKPRQIEAIHWTSDSIPEPLVMESIWKHYESNDSAPTEDELVDILLEDFPLHAVNKSIVRIRGAMVKVEKRLAFREKVTQIYVGCGKTFEADGTGGVMRVIAASFDRSEMGSVFTALRESGYVS